nr:small integral membrane protein 15 isoform X2 [Oryctolagus cuniculus]
MKARVECAVEWAAKDPYDFLPARSPLCVPAAVWSWKLARMVEARKKEQKRKHKHH